MKFTVLTKKWKTKEIEALVIPLSSKEKIPAGLPPLASQLLADAMEQKEFSGEVGETKHVVLPISGSSTLRHVYFVGTGKAANLEMIAFAKQFGQIIRQVQSLKVSKVGFWLRDMLVQTFPQADHLGEMLGVYGLLAGYEFEEYRKKKGSHIKQVNIYLENKKEEESFSAGLERGALIGRLANDSRNLGNHPGNVADPKHLAQFMVNVGKAEKLAVKVLGKKDMEKLGMGGVLGVGRGSQHEPQFIVAEYWGADKKEQPYVVIGKGVTFDSGGISIKPAAMMDEMKFDMSGAAAAFGVLRAAAAMKLPLNIVCLVPAVENMPGPNAYKPGDVLTMMDGSTVEVINTDAEGRIILGDALVYARQYRPKAVIDLATLTGAMAIATHDAGAGLFSRNKELVADLKTAGEQTGDIVWPMPLPVEYKEYTKSKIADLTNLAPMMWGGAITAASFLDHFAADKYPWAHLDIAGVAWATNGKKHLAPGATAAGLRVVLQYLREKAAAKAAHPINPLKK